MRAQYFDCLHHKVSNHCYPLLLFKLYCDTGRVFKKSSKNGQEHLATSHIWVAWSIVINCGPICYNHILAEVFSFIIKVFFNCCLLCEVKIVLSSVLWCNSCYSVFFSFHLCAGFSHFSEILKPVPSWWIPTCYVQFSPPSFLATSNILPLKVMYICWLQACDEITANELQRDAL